jgi:hypothetical protein
VDERFGVATDEFTQGPYERADELESERAELEPPDDDDDGRGGPADSYVDDVRGMFDGLENALRSSCSSQPVADIVQCGPGRPQGTWKQRLRETTTINRCNSLIALVLRGWLAALDDFRNWLIREAA